MRKIFWIPPPPPGARTFALPSVDLTPSSGPEAPLAQPPKGMEGRGKERQDRQSKGTRGQWALPPTEGEGSWKGQGSVAKGQKVLPASCHPRNARLKMISASWVSFLSHMECRSSGPPNPYPPPGPATHAQ